MNNAKLIWITPEAEKVIGYCARVSNPANQDNPDVSKLLAYCIKHKHWSIFEQASACFEIETSRAISAQILRHRSFAFQEFSQRYAEAIGIEDVEARRQDTKNRQNSTNDLSEEDEIWWAENKNKLFTDILATYKEAVHRGIAKESARFVLPMATTSRLYMNGTIRSWIHYIDLRTGHGTQKEHQDIAVMIKNILMEQLPVVAKALEWNTQS